jgi:hypothetical protein
MIYAHTGYAPEGVTIKQALEQMDNVNHPAHYTGAIECIDAIAEATKDLKGMEAVCTGNAIKYLWRWKKKNGVEDLKKAQWYLNKLISVVGDGHENVR